MFDSGEILVIAVVAFLVFGPKRLPELARTLGKIVYEIREGMRNATVEMKKEFAEIEKTEKEPEAESPPEKNHPGKEGTDPQKPEPPR